MEKIKFPLNNLMSEIATRENVEEAFDYVVSHLECREHVRNTILNVRRCVKGY